MDKVELLPPAQDLLVSDWAEKPAGLEGPLRLAFVGGHFFRKGGLELLRVVRQLLAEGADVTLELVSSLAMTTQTGDTEEEWEEARQLMEEGPEITWHGALPNREVLEVFKGSHIGLLPSYIETYGYTVLEAQACGCATITTDIRAFPDTNPDEVGWRVEIDGDDFDFRTRNGRALISERIERGLYCTLKTILEDPMVVREKGEAALNRIAEEHAPARHGERLREIYREALSN